MDLDWFQTLALLCLGLTLFLWAREYDRRPIDLEHPRLIPPLPLMAFGLILTMLMIAHLLTLASGHPFTGSAGLPGEPTWRIDWAGPRSGGPAPVESVPLSWLLLIAGLGLVVGSFLNVVIHRLPIMIDRADAAAHQEGAEATALPARYNLLTPSSSCPACGHQLRWYENIPLLSYLALRGRCSACRAPIGLRYPLVELAAALLPLLLAPLYPAPLELAALTLFCWFALAITLIDWAEFLIPDGLSLPLLALGLVAGISGVHGDAVGSLGGALSGAALFEAIRRIGARLARRPVMGLGDVKLIAAIGAWVGWSGVPVAVFVGCAVGSLFGLSLIASGLRQRSDPIPFGPFLMVGALAALAGGDALAARVLFPPL